MKRQQVKMFTLCGEPVWTDRRNTYWIGEQDEGFHARMILVDDPTGHWRDEGLRKAQEQIGEPCGWKQAEPIEVGEI